MTSSPSTIRPLTAIAEKTQFPPLSAQALDAFRQTNEYRQIKEYFADYPPRSFMYRDSRAVLYTFVRLLRPKIVAEIGTLFAGTAELLARALWENGQGLLYTTDPYGADRCPAIISSWPRQIQTITHYYPLNSMEFFVELDRHHIVPDLVLVDGNHDFEFALFDLMMASRLCARGGVIIMDNAEQSGPWRATREFLAANPGWREIGSSLAEARPTQPFDETRASLAETSFIIVQAPQHYDIGAGPHSWGQNRVTTSLVGGFRVDLPAQATKGTLHYQAILRGFADGNRDVQELKAVGDFRIEATGAPLSVDHRLPTPLSSDMRSRHTDPVFTFEIDLSWRPDPGAPPLAVSRVPLPLE